MSTLRHYIVMGRVQGVGYRKFVQREAENLQLRGWVKNLEDGSVEALALADPDVLRDFETRLRKGPLFSKVKDIRAEDLQEYNELPDAFLILQ